MANFLSAVTTSQAQPSQSGWTAAWSKAFFSSSSLPNWASMVASAPRWLAVLAGAPSPSRTDHGCNGHRHGCARQQVGRSCPAASRLMLQLGIGLIWALRLFMGGGWAAVVDFMVVCRSPAQRIGGVGSGGRVNPSARLRQGGSQGQGRRKREHQWALRQNAARMITVCGRAIKKFRTRWRNPRRKPSAAVRCGPSVQDAALMPGGIGPGARKGRGRGGRCSERLRPQNPAQRSRPRSADSGKYDKVTPQRQEGLVKRRSVVHMRLRVNSARSHWRSGCAGFPASRWLSQCSSRSSSSSRLMVAGGFAQGDGLHPGAGAECRVRR